MHLNKHLSRLAAGLVLLWITAGTPPPASAQNQRDKEARGTITGRVFDQATGDPLPFANVIFQRVTKEFPEGSAVGGTMGLADGTFSGKVESGHYNVHFMYVGYELHKVDRVFVPPGETVVLEAGLVESVAETIDPVIVTAKAIQNAQGSMLAKTKNAPVVSEAITSEFISKTGDSNAADALQRVTGVSVVGGRYVFVRGLGERYISTLVNGASVATPEADKRVVPLDLFPTGVLDNIIVQKTYSPDMEANFAGGVVQINTSSAMEGHSLKQSLSLGYTNSNADGFLSYQGGSFDWLGFDDGTRTLPDVVAGYNTRIDRDIDLETRRELTKEFNDTWTPTSSKRMPNFSYSGVYNREFKMFNRPSGLLLSASLGNSYKNLLREENFYRNEVVEQEFVAQQSNHEVLGGVTGSYSIQLKGEKDPDVFKLNFLGTKNSTDITKVSEGSNDDLGADYMEKTELSYLERSVTQTVAQGAHSWGPTDGKLDWNAGYSTATREEPDRRSYIYQEQPGTGDVVVGGRSVWPFQRLFGSGNQYQRTLSGDYELPVTRQSSFAAKLKLGGDYMNRDQSSEYRRFGFTCSRGGECRQDQTLLPEDLIVRSDTVNYVLEEVTKANDSWNAEQTIKAGYLMADAALGSWGRLVLGGRYESSNQFILAQSPYAQRGQQLTEEIRNNDEAWYPSVNLKLMPDSKTNIRLAYSQTVNRPELRELSPFEYYNFEKGWQEKGNPDLKTAEIDNVDLRYEYYPMPGEMFALSLFSKSIHNPIQKYLDPLATGFQEIPVNGNKGVLQGFEGELRLSLYTLYRAMDWLLNFGGGEPALGLSHWSLMANYSRIHSEVELDLGGRIVTKPFIGQSAYSVNLGVFFQKGNWESSLLYKSFGDRLALFSVTKNYEDLTETPPNKIDFLMGYKLSEASKIKLSVKNILDEQSMWSLAGGLPVTSYNEGRSVSLGVSFTPTFGEF